MAKSLMKALHTEMTADLTSIAALLQSKGRGKDTVLAHITPKEAALLKNRGGRGSKNPETGLLEFDDGFDAPSTGFSAEFAPGGSTVQGVGDSSYAAPQPILPAESTGLGQATIPMPEQVAPVVPSGGGVMPGLNFSGATPQVAPAMGSNISAPELNVQTPPDYSLTGGVPQAAPGTSLTNAPAMGAGATDKNLIQSLGLDKISGNQLVGGALGALGITQARNAATQGQQAKQELLAQATPYQQQGKQLVTAAQSGQLSPASAQAYQAAQAKAAQAAQSSGGGVGVVQSQAALESLRQQLLAGDLNIGLQIQAIGDKIAQGAISAGVQADQYVNTLTGNYATNIGRVLMGISPDTTAKPGAPA